MKFIPQLNLILVRTKNYVDDAEKMELPGTSKEVRTKKTEGGLYIPAAPLNTYTQQIQDKEYEMAEVVAVGPGSYLSGTFVKPDLKVGDIVAYLKMTGRTWIYDEGEYKYFALSFLDIMAKVEDLVL